MREMPAACVPEDPNLGSLLSHPTSTQPHGTPPPPWRRAHRAAPARGWMTSTSSARWLRLMRPQSAQWWVAAPGRPTPLHRAFLLGMHPTCGRVPAFCSRFHLPRRSSPRAPQLTPQRCGACRRQPRGSALVPPASPVRRCCSCGPMPRRCRCLLHCLCLLRLAAVGQHEVTDDPQPNRGPQLQRHQGCPRAHHLWWVAGTQPAVPGRPQAHQGSLARAPVASPPPLSTPSILNDHQHEMQAPTSSRSASRRGSKPPPPPPAARTSWVATWTPPTPTGWSWRPCTS